MFGSHRVKGKFSVRNTTRKLLAYRVRLGQIDKSAIWEVSGGSAVLRPGLSRQVKIFMPPGQHFQDVVLIDVFLLDSKALLSLQNMSSAEMRQSLRVHKPDVTETLTLHKAEVQEKNTTEQKHKEEYKCYHCNHGFKFLGALNIHIRSEHASQKLYVCDVPGCKHKGSATQVDLKRHTIRVHREKEVMLKEKEKCPSCEKSFTTKKLLLIHKEANHVATICRVEWCPREFENTKLERIHYKNQHSRDQGKARPKEDAVPPPCNKCGKELTTVRGMRSHMKNHMNVDTAIGAQVTLGNPEGGEQIEEENPQEEPGREEQATTEHLEAELGEDTQTVTQVF